MEVENTDSSNIGREPERKKAAILPRGHKPTVEPLVDEASNLSLAERYVEHKKAVKDSDSSDSASESESGEEETSAKVAFNITPNSLPSGCCGTIKYIECIDFMCHKHLKVKLGGEFCFGKVGVRHCGIKYRLNLGKINFITGQNGSGKSAVIAALQICLGLNAKDAHRGAKLKNLIRHGSHGNAIVRVCLDNSGVDAYEHEKFGDVIIVERVLRRGGGSGYKLVSADFKTISTKKADVSTIKERFNLFVNNPCCILDQENSKMFLKGSAKDKYNLFLKATELERMLKNYDAEKQFRANAKDELKEKKDMLPLLEREVQIAKENLEDLHSLDKLKEKLEILKSKRIWAGVRDSHLEFETAEKALDKAKRKLESAQKKVVVVQQEKAEMMKEQEQIQGGVKETIEKLDEVKGQMKRKEEELHNKTAPKGQIEKRHHAAKRQLQSYRNQRTQLQEDIKAIQKRLIQGNKESEKIDLMLKLQDAERQKTGNARKHDDLKVKIEEIAKKNEDLDSEMRRAKVQYEQARRKAQMQEKELENLEATKRDKCARFGKWVPGLLAAIEQNVDKFHRKPLHVGLNVALKQMDYWRPVEKHLNSYLVSFIVHDDHDKNVLRKLAASKRIQPTSLRILRTKFLDKRHNIRSVEERLLTIERALDVKDDNVYNALVDFAQMEGQVLVATTEIAMRETFLGPKGDKHMPQGMLACYDKEGTKFSVKKKSESKIANFSSSNQSRYFSTEVSAQIEQYKVSLKNVSYEVKRHKEEYELRLQTNHDNIKALKKMEREQKQVVETQSVLEQSIHEMTQQQNDNDADDDTVALNDKRENVGEIDQQIEKQEAVVQNISTELSTFEDSLKPLQAEVVKAQKSFELVNAEVEKMRKKLTNFEEDFTPVIAKERQARERVKQQSAKEEESLAKYTKLKAGFERVEKMALDFCKGERLEVVEKEEVIVKQMKVTEKQVKKELEKRANSKIEPAVLIERARSRHRRAVSSLETRKREISVVKRRLKNLRMASKARLEKWKAFKEHTKHVTTSMFDYYLSQRNHRGTVEFDDDNAEINFQWAKSGSTQLGPDDGITDTRQLSGGEKSFTTLAFLLALGKVVECPFRVMDEFDVFMDAGNRKTAMKLLVQMAQEPNVTTKQFIFITPNDISMVEDGQDVKKLKMNPPEKDYGRAGSRLTQATLTGMQQ